MYKDILEYRVGMVILNYNDSATTLRLLSQVRGYQLIDRIVLVDNCSTDESTEYLAKATSNKTILICEAQNNGYSSGNNVGMRFLYEKDHCDIVIVANPDIEITQEALLSCIRFLSKKKEYVAVAPVMYQPDGQVSEEIFWEPRSYAQALKSCFYLGRIAARKKLPECLCPDIDYLDVGTIPGSLIIFNAKAIEQLGYFDEGTFLYFEEDILGMRCRFQNKKMALLVNEEYIHAHGTTTKKTFSKSESVRQYYVSMLYYLSVYKNIKGIKKMLIILASKYSIVCFRVLDKLTRPIRKHK